MTPFKHIRRTLSVAVGLLAAVLCCGAGGGSCDAESIDHMLDPETLDTSNRPLEGIIEIQEIIRLRRGDDREVMAPTVFGDDICLDKTIKLDSADIKSVKAITIEKQKPYCSLELTLTPRGKRRWIGFSVPNKAQHVAFIVDGIVYRTFVPRMFFDDVTDSIIVDGPFDPATAKRLESNSARNYFRLK